MSSRRRRPVSTCIRRRREHTMQLSKTEMASNIASLGGYDCDFVEPPPSDLLCLICTFVARDPVQMNCCGKVYCKACLTELKKRSNKCPQCREEGNGFDDRRSDMHIKALRVKCANLGCAWVGELRFLEEHHATCDHALLPCPNECIDGTTPVRVLRKDLATHLKEKCPNRSNQCPHCGEEGKLCDITTSHLESCTKIEVPCPNKGCSAKLPRCDIPEHRKTFCPFEEVACKYSTIGCKEKSLRKELKDHENNDQLHLHIAMEAILKHDSSQTRLNKVETIQQDQLARICTLTGGHFTFKVDKFSQCKASGEAFYSPPFYTHHGGYKMCIKVYANGVGNGEGTHVSEYATLMRGENDDNLTWPFTGDVTVELLNQLEDKEHHQDTIPYRDDKDNEYNSRVVDRERAPSGWGRSTFISHADLGPATTRQFLKDDCLYFRVSVKATPNPKPWLTCTT